jgi:GNAT superfamily N-acetyltransferase
VEIVLHDDVEKFDRLARPFYAADPLRHTVALTVLDGLVGERDEAAALVTVHEAGVIVGAALWSAAGRPVLVSGVAPEHAAAVGEAIDAELPGVSGPAPAAEAFAAAHTARTRAASQVDLRRRLHVLGTLVPPEGVPGAPRRATEADVDVLAAWRAAFNSEEPHGGDPDPREEAARALRLGYGEMLWEVDGEPVAQASARRPVVGMARIGPVYTPPEQRKRGYAAAVTAAATRWALDAGASNVLLFTDASNATTNALYPRIGYCPLHDELNIGFTRP